MVREIVRVEIALVALEARAVGVDILQLARDGAGSACLHIGDGRIDGHAAGIGLRGRGKEKNRVGQRQTRLRQAQLQSAVDAGLDDGDGLRIGKADILRHRAQDAAAGGRQIARL